MRRGWICAALALLAAAPSAEAAPRVGLMVAGRTRVLLAPRTVSASAAHVHVGGRRCAVGAATPLAALAASPLAFSLHDYGACSARTVDASGLFVFRIGPDGNSGRSGWTYKVGTRSGTTGAADMSGPFGTGRRLRSGQRVTWFWCALSRRGTCQRTLGVRPARRHVAPGARLTVTVLGYDDNGHAVRVAGATVRLAGATARTRANGTALVVAPRRAGRVAVTARHPGLVPAWPEEVRVG